MWSGRPKGDVATVPRGEGGPPGQREAVDAPPVAHHERLVLVHREDLGLGDAGVALEDLLQWAGDWGFRMCSGFYNEVSEG